MPKSIKFSQSDEASGFSIIFQPTLAVIVYINLPFSLPVPHSVRFSATCFCDLNLSRKNIEWKKIVSNEFSIKATRIVSGIKKRINLLRTHIVSLVVFASFSPPLSHPFIRPTLDIQVHSLIQIWGLMCFYPFNDVAFSAITSINNLAARSFAAFSLRISLPLRASFWTKRRLKWFLQLWITI